MLPGREPLIEIGIPGNGAAEDSALQFGKFELLVGD